MKKAKEEYERILSIPEAEYEDYINQKKKEIVTFHFENNAFYKNLVGNSLPDKWHQLPVMTKADYQKPLEQKLSIGYNNPKHLYTNKTSGSTGTPMFFAIDKFAHAMTWANIIYKYGWYGIDLNSSYQARFYGIPKDFIGYRKERLKDFLGKRYRFSIFDLTDDALERILKKFKSTPFQYINGYTSSIVLFANYLESKGIVLRAVCPTLKVCITTAEMLFDKDKALLEKQFGVRVVNEYGASETGILAITNLEDDWQVSSELSFIEILDENNNPVPLGAEGKVVVTNLFNKAHPFIRYEIGDMGVLDEKSTFKKPIFKHITGRTNDFVVLPSGKKASGLTFYYVTKTVMQNDGNIQEFVIKQIARDTFEVLYKSNEPLTAIQIINIKAAAKTYLEPNLNFNFTRKDFIPRSKSGKLKQFESLI
ncbi:phenylacetate-CoA ligase [Aequorivita viscosa]|uniref:Phenylacetate-CoA ligase n=2 Tax=Aequorivita viscosa TaxID=797419 RepID=A0A1M6C0C5_9FLAO|nr:phenylacetate-CoA ligase [Aequorivita viscosa]SHI54476.1 phenylacetate-CoA ligase [Aequorivita viscosa]